MRLICVKRDIFTSTEGYTSIFSAWHEGAMTLHKTYYAKSDCSAQAVMSVLPLKHNRLTTRIEGDLTYTDEFQIALHNTRALGCGINADIYSDRLYTNQVVVDQLERLLVKHLRGDTSSDNIARTLVSKCLHVHAQLQNEVGEILKKPVHFTLGYLTRGDYSFHKFSIDEVYGWLRDGIPNLNNLQVHAWLTTPAMEIIDFTFNPTAESLKAPLAVSPYGSLVIAGHFSGIEPYSYHPIVVGDDLRSKLEDAITYKS